MPTGDPMYGQCARCGGALTTSHICAIPFIAPEQPAMKTSRLCHVVRVYAATANLDNKELAAAWGCSESTVSRFLNGRSWPDAQTTCRIVAWLLAS